MKLKFLVIILSIIIMGCSTQAESVERKENTILLATTTSTDDSGLLNYLLPRFTQDTGIQIQYVSVGTGQALELGRNGDVDVVLVHAREQEIQFVHNGHGVKRYPVMYNDFVLVGPKDDPASIKNMQDIGLAMKAISSKGVTFISRGDNSGTHIRELSIWQSGGVSPTGNWYIEAGQGMGSVLFMAHELQAYTLSDRATWLSLKGKLDLEIILEGHPQLINQYGVIAVNPEIYDHLNHQGAQAFIDWLIGPMGQGVINEFGLDEYGQQLFFANYERGE